jgi:DNA-directed RNA polymerase specialized sigma24 family protein
MSPLSVRRYRAERLLRREFEGMRSRVLAIVRSRLRAAGVRLDLADLEACYSQAWHGLYTTMLEGDQVEVASPEGWLALVTYRRAIDEHRSRVRTAAHAYVLAGGDRARDGALEPGAPERDLAGELDDRARLRQLMEGLRGRLTARERQAAALCYLQGCSRAQAAARMDVSEARMRKLMDGRPGSPGVATKVGQLLDTIRAGSYCAEQSSLMRGFAFGILDPEGERYALAIAHQRECPACRAHVLSLRGLAAVLPPLPLPLMLGAGVAAGAGATTGIGAGAGTGAGVGSGAGVGAGTSVGSVAGAGAGGAAGGAAAAGGGWLLAGGGVAGKLAVGCLLAVGVGAGCVALSIAPLVAHRPVRRHRAVHLAPPRGGYRALNTTPASISSASAISSTRAATSTRASVATTAHALTPAAKASREFGLEQPTHRATPPAARTSVSHSAHLASATGAESPPSPTASSSGSSAGGEGTSAAAHESGGSSSAAREFGLG